MYKNIFSKKTIGNAVAVLALAFSMTSCDDFVDVVPKGKPSQALLRILHAS